MKNECCNINDVIDEFYNYIKNFTLKKVQDESVAEDIVQEVMLKLVESHHKNTQIHNCKAWLFQVARNTIVDYFNKNKYRVDLQNVPFLTQQEETAFELAVYDYLVPMIEFLPEKYAEPLQWSDLDKLPQLEIANKLGITLSAAKMRIQRARVKLLELFVECCDMEYDAKGNFVTCTVKDYCTPLKEHLLEFQRTTKAES